MKKENGSIAIFALVALLFMTAFLIISYANITNKSKSLKEQFNIIQGIYYKSDDNSSYKDAYTELRKKNKQTLTTYTENSNKVELEKTFKSNLSDYKIYGNTISKGTATMENSDKLESLGNKTKNLWNESLLLENSKITQNTKGYKVADYPASFNNKNKIIKELKEQLKPNTKYTLTKETSNYIDNSSGMIQIRSQSAALVQLGYGNGIKSTTFSLTQEEIDSIDRIYIYGKASPNETILEYIQLEEGETSTSYEPYGWYKIPVEVSGKNLVNIPEITSQTPNATIECNITKPFTVSCQEYPSLITNNNGVEANIWRIALTYRDGTKKYVMDNGLKKIKNTTCTFEASEENPVVSMTYRNVYIREGSYKGIQIEYGKTSTSFEPYIEPTIINIYLEEPLRKVGNSADYIDFKNKNLVREVGVNSDGSLYSLDTSIKEKMELPDIPIYEDYTQIQILTDISPSRIEIEYDGYTLD